MTTHQQIETAIADVIKHLGHISGPMYSTHRSAVFSDNKISLEEYQRTEGDPSGYAVLVIAPDQTRYIVYMRDGADDRPKVLREGMWIKYLADLREEANSLPERKRKWDGTQPHTETKSNLKPIDDSSIFAIPRSQKAGEDHPNSEGPAN
ncbi:MAG: hypothetical protein OXC95_15480 [Dehalococcoidia bacterium]|nr:hypothetical protein [Dehalococcoidia bacterium]